MKAPLKNYIFRRVKTVKIIRMSLKRKLLIMALVILVSAALYSSFWFFLYAAAENGPGYHLDRTPGDRHFLLAAIEWPLAALTLYSFLKTR